MRIKPKHTNTQAAIIYAALAISIVGFNCWQMLWKGFYYQSMAVFLVLVFYVFRQLAWNKPRLLKAVTIGLWLTVNNLIDELFFVPGEWQWNEYVFAAIIIFFILKPKRNAGSAP